MRYQNHWKRRTRWTATLALFSAAFAGSVCQAQKPAPAGDGNRDIGVAVKDRLTSQTEALLRQNGQLAVNDEEEQKPGAAVGLSAGDKAPEPAKPMPGQPPAVFPSPVPPPPVARVPYHNWALPNALGSAWEGEAKNRLNLAVLLHAGNREQEILGTTLRPVEPLLRAQIDIPEGQGLIVGGIELNSPAAMVGLKTNDILLTLNGKPLAKFEDVMDGLKADANAKELSLDLLREGKKLSLPVKPVAVVTFGPVEKVDVTYMIGVTVSELDDVAKAQMPGQTDGLVVTDVIADKPALKAGLKQGDILTAIDDKPLKSTQELTAAVQGSKGKPVVIRYKRKAEVMTVEIKPEPREEPANTYAEALRFYRVAANGVQPEVVNYWPARVYQANVNDAVHQNAVAALAEVGAQPTSDQRIASLEAEVKALQSLIRKLVDTIDHRDGQGSDGSKPQPTK